MSTAPVHDTGDTAPVDGVALCLSGGGYRAMLYHVGALRRLNELGYLRQLTVVSSVSGGSIAAATLGLHWGRLAFDDAGVATPASFESAVVAPLRALAGHTIDVAAGLRGLLTPRTTIADRVAAAYREHLFGDATLQALPGPGQPHFVINATNLMTGALWRFTRPFMADWTIGIIHAPRVPLATAVAASSAFPPVLSPLRLAVDPRSWDPDDLPGENHEEPFLSSAVLSDGGVYDNLGLEPAWKNCRTVLVSDGGGHMEATGTVHGDWVRQSVRVNQVIDHQVRSLRARQTIAGFMDKSRRGTYWGIRGDVANYGPPDGSLETPAARTRLLAKVPTRLAKMDALGQERLINWGYAACDVAMRRWVVPDAPAPGAFPYPGAGVG